MKVAIVLLAVLALGFSAPRQSKLFHEHVEDFLDIIDEELEEKLPSITLKYLESEEFLVSLSYLSTSDFKNLFYEMESLPEVKAVVDFLENNNIDISYFIKIFYEALEEIEVSPQARQQASGGDFSSFIYDVIAVFPKSKLSALFDQKMAEVEEFKTAIESFQTEEWNRIWDALWGNETFKAEAQTLKDHGIDLLVLLDEIMAIFGQN